MINMQHLIISIFLILGVISSSCSDTAKKKKETGMEPSKVVLKKESQKYQLYVNGQPFYLKGAGLEFGNMESLAKHGGNSFRTWLRKAKCKD